MKTITTLACILLMVCCALGAETAKPKIKVAADGFPAGHDTPEGVDPFQRMQNAGIVFGLAGENLALAPTLPPELRRTNLPATVTGRQFFVKLSYQLRF